MLATSSLVIRHVALADRGETIYEKRYQSEDQGFRCKNANQKLQKMSKDFSI